MSPAKGKIKRAEREHEDALGAAMSEKLVIHKKPRREPETSAQVSTGALRGVIGETMARVYSELWPGMRTHTAKDDSLDAEIAEEGYILVNAMIYGTHTDTPRKGLKIRDAAISSAATYCGEHDA